MKKLLIAGILTLSFVLIGASLMYQFKLPRLLADYFETDQKNQFGNVTLHYPAESEPSTEGLEAYFQELTALQKEWFDYEAETEVAIFLTKSEENLQYDDNGGYSEDWDIIYVNSDLEPEEFRNTLAHEMAHYYFIEYVKNKNVEIDAIPLWIHEGVAMAFAQTISPIVITDLVSASEPLMEIAPEKMKNGKSAYHPEQYTEMMFAVNYLIHQYKLGVITELVEKMSNGDSFRAAFEKKTEIDLDSYHTAFDHDPQILQDIEEFMQAKRSAEAKTQILAIFAEKGFYFNEASYLLNYLADIYIEESDYPEAEKYLAMYTEYMDAPTIYETLSGVASFYDHDLAIEYAEQAVQSAERNEWNVAYFKRQLNELRK